MNCPATSSEPPPSDVSLRLACFPFAGGGEGFFYRALASRPAWIELLPVRLPGRDQRLREPPLTSVSQMADEAQRQLAPLDERPLALFGYSLGALVAYETAQRLMRLDNQSLPLCLIVAACPAPHRPRRSRPVAHLPDGKLLDELTRRYGRAPLTDELCPLLLPVVRREIAAAEAYRVDEAEPPLACPIVALGGTQDQEVTQAELTAWRQRTSAFFFERVFSGGHFFLDSCRDSVTRTIVQQLRQVLERRREP